MISERLSALREEMRREHFAAFIFPTRDPHNSEYLPDHWKGREWISGFNGSAGTAVVTLNAAALWTDSRYFLAAEEQLKGTEYRLMKLQMPGTPTIAEWIGQQIGRNDETEVGIDGATASEAMVEQMASELRHEGGLTLRSNFDPLQRIWADRPSVPLNPIALQPIEYTGKTCHEKLNDIRKALRDKHADGMLVAALDDIAWTLNLRGTDVHCNPVFVAYLLISTQRVTLFTDHRKITPEVADYLRNEGVETAEYDRVTAGLKDYFEYNILLDPDEISHELFHKATCRVVKEASPIPFLKAVKTEAEIDGFHRAMIRDGVAMVKFLRWLQPAVAKGGETELSVSAKLAELRSEQPLFKDISFDTIAAYQAHGAIVHYEPTAETDVPLRPEGLLLVDSGAHYQDGTTDLTRTIALGETTPEQRRAYTAVLKAHLQLQHLVFPSGVTGTQIDAIARRELWREGLQYYHGTGHGVGSFLNVHEGPHQIRMEWRGAPLRARMTVTDEPGVYLAGRFGVRTENVLLIVHHSETEFGEFLTFEPLTLCPIDTAPIIDEMLTDEERQWLKTYHDTVYEKLAPHLDDEERAWLRDYIGR